MAEQQETATTQLYFGRVETYLEQGSVWLRNIVSHNTEFLRLNICASALIKMLPGSLTIDQHGTAEAWDSSCRKVCLAGQRRVLR